jgi:ABC-type transport system involved in multi-copper enzyme maturation permease subunit
VKVPVSLRGPYVVARHEFLVNLKSVRLLIMLVVLALVVVGGAYSLGAGTTGGSSRLTPVEVWGHFAIAPAGGNLAVAWVTDPFGNPFPDRTVLFQSREDGETVELGEVRTDAEGFARLAIAERIEFTAVVRIGTAEFSYGFLFFESPVNFTTSMRVEDFDGDGFRGDLGIHVLTRAGDPALANVSVNDTMVTSTNARGYAFIELPPGPSTLTVEVAGERETTTFSTSTVPAAFGSSPEFSLLFTAFIFVTFVVPIIAIVTAFDAISKERVQGTLDLLLSRPVSRAGTLIGKMAGTFASVAVPVTAVNLAGIGLLTYLFGRPPEWGLASASLGLALLLIAFYVLIQLTLSTLAKTSGTAILFGILVWLGFNVLYPVVTLILSSILFAGNFEAQFRFAQVAGVGNPSWIYQQLLTFAAPAERGGALPSTTLGLEPWPSPPESGLSSSSPSHCGHFTEKQRNRQESKIGSGTGSLQGLAHRDRVLLVSSGAIEGLGLCVLCAGQDDEVRCAPFPRDSFQVLHEPRRGPEPPRIRFDE